MKTVPTWCQTGKCWKQLVWLNAPMFCLEILIKLTQTKSLFQGHPRGCQHWDHCRNPGVLQPSPSLLLPKQILSCLHKIRSCFLLVFLALHEWPLKFAKGLCNFNGAPVRTWGMWLCWAITSVGVLGGEIWHLSQLQSEGERWLHLGFVTCPQKPRNHCAIFRLLEFISFLSLSQKPKACNILFPVWGFPEIKTKTLAPVKKPIESLLFWNYAVCISSTAQFCFANLTLFLYLLRKCIFYSLSSLSIQLCYSLLSFPPATFWKFESLLL